MENLEILKEIKESLAQVNTRLARIEPSLDDIERYEKRRRTAGDRLIEAQKEKWDEAKFESAESDMLNGYMQKVAEPEYITEKEKEENDNRNRDDDFSEKLCNFNAKKQFLAEKRRHDFHCKFCKKDELEKPQEIKANFLPQEFSIPMRCPHEIPQMGHFANIPMRCPSGNIEVNNFPEIPIFSPNNPPFIMNGGPLDKDIKINVATVKLLNNLNTVLHKQLGSTAPNVYIDPNCRCQNPQEKIMEGFLNALNAINTIMENRLDGKFNNIFDGILPTPAAPLVAASPDIAQKLDKIIDALNNLKLDNSARGDNISHKSWKKQV
jgi:hypothetical protein